MTTGDVDQTVERFRRVFEQSPIGVAIVAADGTPESVNPSLCRFLGYEPAELRSMSFDEFTHPEDVDADVELYGCLMAGEIPDYQIDKRFLTSDGDVVWGRLAVTAIRDPEGEVRQAVAFVQDVTGERRVREELSARHREQRAVARLGRRALRGEDPGALAEAAVELVADAMAGGAVALLELDDEAGVLRRRTGAGWRAGASGAPAIERAAEGMVGLALEASGPVSSTETELAPGDPLREMMSREGARACLAAAVRPEREPWGLVCALLREAEPDEHHLHFLQAVADLLGQSIRNARDRKALRASERRYRTLFESSRDVVYVTTVDGEIVEMNPAGRKLFGYDRSELLGMQAQGLYADPADRDRFREAVEEAGGSVKDFEVRLRRRDGEVRDCLLTSTARRGPEGEVVGYQGIIRDVTERKQMEAELEHRALHDWLTDLPNRALLRDRLDKAVARAERLERGVALLFVDLDGFKAVNDVYSHAAGDELLLQVASRLTGTFRDEDTVARMGGDEFVVLLERLEGRAPVDRALERAKSVFEAPFRLEAGTVRVDASVGVAVRGLEGAPPVDEPGLVHEADQAMYRAKEMAGTTSRWADRSAGEADGGSADGRGADGGREAGGAAG